MNPAARHELQTLRDLIRYGVSRLNAAQVALGHGATMPGTRRCT